MSRIHCLGQLGFIDRITHQITCQLCLVPASQTSVLRLFTYLRLCVCAARVRWPASAGDSEISSPSRSPINWHIPCRQILLLQMLSWQLASVTFQTPSRAPGAWCDTNGQASLVTQRLRTTYHICSGSWTSLTAGIPVSGSACTLAMWPPVCFVVSSVCWYQHPYYWYW